MNPKLILWPSKFAAFVGMHKYCSYNKTIAEHIKQANAWLEGKQIPYPAKQPRSPKINITSSMYKNIRPMPLITQEDHVVLEIDSVGIGSLITREGRIDTPVEVQEATCWSFFLDVLNCLFTSPTQVSRESIQPLQEYRENDRIDDKLVRGIEMEPIAIKSFVLPNLKVIGNKMKVTREFTNFVIKGELDGCIYDENDKLVGIVEVKNREYGISSVSDMFVVNENGYDSAHDLRQLACYWACLPNLEYYYLLQVYDGHIYPTRLTGEFLSEIWKSMVTIAENRSLALRS